MHETTERLFRAAKALHRRTEPHQVAALMNISQQVLKNWESRGISDTGMLDAEERIGCSAIWIRTGRGDTCKGLLPHAREERATYHIQLDNKATYVIDGIRGFLHLGGFPPNCLGNTPTLKASLMTGTPPRHVQQCHNPRDTRRNVGRGRARNPTAHCRSVRHPSDRQNDRMDRPTGQPTLTARAIGKRAKVSFPLK